MAGTSICGSHRDDVRTQFSFGRQSACQQHGTHYGNVAALLMGPDGSFITGSDFLMDGGVTAAYWYGDLAPA